MHVRSGLSRDPLSPILIAVHEHPESVLSRLGTQSQRDFPFSNIVDVDLRSVGIGRDVNRHEGYGSILTSRDIRNKAVQDLGESNRW